MAWTPTPKPKPDPRVRAPPSTDSVQEIAELVSHLQSAIEQGQTQKAAEMASQLARQRAPVRVERSVSYKARNEVKVKVHIEDREMRAGHIMMSVYSTMSVGLLKHKVFTNFGFPPEIQRWIIGKSLARDESLLCDLMEVSPGSSLFLYLMTAQATGLTNDNLDKVSNPTYTGDNVAPRPKARSMSAPDTSISQNEGRIGRNQRSGQGLRRTPTMPTSLEEWTCRRCTFAENKQSSSQCELCDEERPDTVFSPT